MNIFNTYHTRFFSTALSLTLLTGMLSAPVFANPLGSGDGQKSSNNKSTDPQNDLQAALSDPDSNTIASTNQSKDKTDKNISPIDPSVLEPDAKSKTNDQPNTPRLGQYTPKAPTTINDKAIDLLLKASTDENPFLRANAIEAMQVIPSRALPLCHKGFSDPAPVVRYTALVTAGKLNLKSLVGAIQPLLKDQDPSVRAAALYSLHTLGADINISPMASLLRHDDPRVRANVALLLGLLGDASAGEMLKSAAAAPMPKASAVQAAVTRIQIAEAIAKLGDNTVLNALRAGAYSPYGEVRVVAINAMGEIKDQRMKPALRERLANPDLQVKETEDPAIKEQAELMALSVRLAAAGALARMNDPIGKQVVLDGLKNPFPSLRAQAAHALVHFDGPDTMDALQQMLNDESMQVRVTAASGILQRSNTIAGAK